jgi:prepilin-type N-terminal cleavage/methylation domain-containing protein
MNTYQKSRRRSAFTVVEIMIVVAIISLLAAIAIPRLLRARHDANETVTLSSVRVVSAALERYRAAQNPASYPESLAQLTKGSPPYLDSALASATSAAMPRQGFFYTYARLNPNQFALTASPVTPGVTGTRVFFVNETGEVRLNHAQGQAVQ